MNGLAEYDRFEELEAGRILGDLDTDEFKEWEELSSALDAQPNFELELVAAAVETEYLATREESLPPTLAKQLKTEAAPFVASPATISGQVTGQTMAAKPSWRRILATPQAGWAAAALFAILLALNFFSDRSQPGDSGTANRGQDSITEPTFPNTAAARDALARDSGDLLELRFTGLPGYEGAGGELIWSDQQQEGYMTLSNLPVNDPARNQYQLWIVDPTRDDEPVDGGVFDILPGRDTTVIPIRNPVAVSKPVAFLITLEKPGGVVVSDQKVKVALAAPKA